MDVNELVKYAFKLNGYNLNSIGILYKALHFLLKVFPSLFCLLSVKRNDKVLDRKVEKIEKQEKS